jgi:mono/diheme cytochrome c family protein
LDNQLLTNERLLQRVAIAILVVLFVLTLLIWAAGAYPLHKPDPYIQDVLALKGDPIQGHAIFQMNCSGCHGIQANGRVGPSLRGISDRKSKVNLIHQVISGQTPPMPQFQPNPKEMADLLSYLGDL